MAPKKLSVAHQKMLNDAKAAVAAAEQSLQALRNAGMESCDCNGEEVPIGKYRCRKVPGQEIVTCQRCLGGDQWFDTGVECENGIECSECG